MSIRPDSITLEDWGEEIFAEGVGFKWRKWARGRGRKKFFLEDFTHLDSSDVLGYACVIFKKPGTLGIITSCQ